jgi:hypothetical protein
MESIIWLLLDFHLLALRCLRQPEPTDWARAVGFQPRYYTSIVEFVTAGQPSDLKFRAKGLPTYRTMTLGISGIQLRSGLYFSF